MTSATIIPFPKRTEFEPWVNKKQIAQHLGFSERWVDYQLQKGLPSEMIGGRRRFKISNAEKWLKDQSERTGAV